MTAADVPFLPQCSPLSPVGRRESVARGAYAATLSSPWSRLSSLGERAPGAPSISQGRNSSRRPLHYEGRVGDARLLAGSAGTFSLENERFFSPRSGRACPLVPELTYPFCTRPEPRAHPAKAHNRVLDRTQEVAGSSPACSITGTRSSQFAARPKRAQFATFDMSAAVSPRAAGN